MKPVFMLIFLTLARISFAEVDSSEPAVSAQESLNRAIATRVFEEIFNQGRFDVANEIYAPEFRNHGLRRDVGLEEDQNAVHREKQAFPDLKMTIDLLLAKGEFVTVVWIFRGTHTGPGMGLPTYRRHNCFPRYHDLADCKR
jgi:predicted SnoaL-like aldol condensation-catalyzing enzyme